MTPVVFPDEIDRKIVFVGLPKSGKTTLVRRLRHGDEFDPETQTTIGVAIELIEHALEDGRKAQFLALDCGGQLEFAKAIWQPHVEVANGVVFLFDSTEPESVDSAHSWLLEVLEWMKHDKSDTPLLFLANKSDREDALNLAEVIKRLDLSKHMAQPKSFAVYQVSALKGTNVDEAFNWFFERLERDFPTNPAE